LDSHKKNPEKRPPSFQHKPGEKPGKKLGARLRISARAKFFCLAGNLDIQVYPSFSKFPSFHLVEVKNA